LAGGRARGPAGGLARSAGNLAKKGGSEKEERAKNIMLKTVDLFSTINFHQKEETLESTDIHAN